ncbi:carboxypeptidase regulatory-like domain-containing protein [Actinokineospora sp. NPDC004072]
MGHRQARHRVRLPRLLRRRRLPAPEVDPDDEGFVPVIRGTVVDSATGEPVRNAYVRLDGEWTADTATTDENGVYEFVQDPDGPLPVTGLTIDVDAQGYRGHVATLQGADDHALVHDVRLASVAPQAPGPPAVVWITSGSAAALGLAAVAVLLLVRRRSAGAQFQGFAAVPAVLGQDIHVGSAGGAVAEAAGHQVVTTSAAGEQGPETSALRVGEAVSTHADIQADAADQGKPSS